MWATIASFASLAVDWLLGLVKKREASAKDLARALKHERDADEADKRAASDSGDVDDRLRKLGGLRRPRS